MLEPCGNDSMYYVHKNSFVALPHIYCDIIELHIESGCFMCFLHKGALLPLSFDLQRGAPMPMSLEHLFFLKTARERMTQACRGVCRRPFGASPPPVSFDSVRFCALLCVSFFAIKKAQPMGLG